jgi:hypothetical protein
MVDSPAYQAVTHLRIEVWTEASLRRLCRGGRPHDQRADKTALPSIGEHARRWPKYRRAADQRRFSFGGFRVHGFCWSPKRSSASPTIPRSLPWPPTGRRRRLELQCVVLARRRRAADEISDLGLGGALALR